MEAASALGAPVRARLPTMVSERLAKKFSRNLKERAIEALLFFAAFVSVFTTAGIVYILVKESAVFFTQVPLWDFLTDPQWTPLFDDAHFGSAVLLSGTLTSSAVALLVAIPVILYQIWMFIVPGLKDTEARYARSFVIAGSVSHTPLPNEPSNVAASNIGAQRSSTSPPVEPSTGRKPWST